MDPRIIEVMRNARKPIEMNVKPGNQVLILADTQTEPLVWQAFAAACVEVGAEPTVVVMVPRQYHCDNPPPGVAAAMMKADVNVLVTSKAILHSPVGHEVMKAGHPCIASEELSVEMLTQGGVTADYAEVQALSQKVADVWTQGNRVRITCDNGTDLVASLAGRKGYTSTGIITKQEGIDLYCGAFPDGESGVPPVEDSTNGVAVFDTTAHFLGRLREPMKFVVRNGVVVEILGGAQAAAFDQALKDYGDENSRIVGEIAIGVNPKARVTGVIREDKKLWGTVHVGLGRNSDVGGVVDSKTHADGVIRYPNVWVDDRLIVDHGKIVI